MIKLKDLLFERIDYIETAKGLVKKYNLRSKVKITTGKNSGEYVAEKDLITLRSSYSSTKEFLLSVLHEIKHALDANRLGVKKYLKKYDQAGTMAANAGKDPHDDNRWEIQAEKWAINQYNKYYKKVGVN